MEIRKALLTRFLIVCLITYISTVPNVKAFKAYLKMYLFDCVNNNVLINKLDNYGVRGNVKDWFKLLNLF